MIILKAEAGLCNKLLAISSVIKLAKEPHQREDVFSLHDKGDMADGIVDPWLLSKTKRIYGAFPSCFSLVALKIDGTELEWIKK